MTKIAPADVASMPDQFDAVARTPGSTGNQEFASLLAQVVGESNFRPHAENRTTGAAGPFQFVKNTWLALLQKHGQELGVKPDLIRQVTFDAGGRAHVADPEALKEMLSLRHDAVLSARMAAKYLDEGKASLQRLLHRAPTEPEVHMAFVLGPHGAAKLIKAAASAPESPAEAVLPRAAAANPSLFQDKSGRALSAHEAVAFLAAKYRADKAKVAAYAKLRDTAPLGKVDA